MFKGTYISPITPYKSDGTLDEDALAEVIEFLIKAHIDGIYALATAGQGPLLTMEERKRAAEVIVRQNKRRVQIIIHTGAVSTREAVALTEHACSIGADAVASLPPIYVRVDSSSIEQHYRAIKEASSVPVLVYNNPLAQGSALSPDILLDLNAKGLISGVVDSSKNLDFIYRLLEHADQLAVIIASAPFSLPGLLLGCPAVVSAVGNVIPESFVALYKAVQENRLSDAIAIQREILRISLPLRHPQLSGFYEGLAARGVKAGYPRLPLRLPTKDEAKAIHEALKDYKPPCY